MKTLALPDGSLIRLVDIRRARVESHFWSRSQYYVDLDMRNGGIREYVQHISKDEAERHRGDIVSLMQEAWQEVDSYECGFEEGTIKGRSEGYSKGHDAGLVAGRAQGWEKGFQDGRQSIISYLLEKREHLMREQNYDDQFGPSRRRYLRNSIDILSEIIQNLLPRSDEALDVS